MSEEIAPIEKVFSGVYDLWYIDGRLESKQLSRLDVYKLMNSPPAGLIGMKRVLERRVKCLQKKSTKCKLKSAK